MKLSLSCRIAEGFHSKQQSSMPLSELCDLAAAGGFDAICMRPSQLDVHSPAEQVAAAREKIRRRGLEVTMISGDIDIVYNNDRGPNCLRDIRPHLDLAEALEAPLIRVCVKTERDIASARRSADAAAERGITLVHQCHVQSLFETVDQIEQCLRKIDRANFGLIFEAANLEQCRQDYGAATIVRLAPWIRNVYLQNQRICTGGEVTLQTWTGGPISFDVIELPEQGGIDFPVVFQGLRQIGYDGPVTVHQSAPPKGTRCIDSVTGAAEFLRQLIEPK